MVKSFDALVADAAVARSIRSDNLTIWTQKNGIELFQELHKAQVARLYQVTSFLGY